MSVERLQQNPDGTVTVELTCPVRGVPLEVVMTPEVSVTTDNERFYTNVVMHGQVVDPPYELEEQPDA